MTTTNEIADKIASEQNLTKAKGESDRRIRLRFDHDGSHVWSGNIHSRIWQFQDKNTPEREARNPATRATIKVAAAKKLTFQPTKALKDVLNK